MPNESRTPEEYLSDALDLMVKAKWVKQPGPSAKGFGLDWTDRGKLAMEALGYMIEDLGPENFDQQLWWAVGTLANIEFTSQKRANLRRKTSTFVPTHKQRVVLLYDSVFYEIIFAFGISSHDPTDYCAWEHINFSRMGHARTLYDFFETPTSNRKQDDAVSEDFGFPARPIERHEDDRNRLNKQLFHLTYSRLAYNETSKAWPDTILSCLHPRCVEFIQHLLAQGEPLVGPNDVVTWKALLDGMTSGHQLLISRPFRASGVAPGYIFHAGDSLESGRSELTRRRVRS
jgi:hypothetical protein